jgi:WbqC-like protein family
VKRCVVISQPMFFPWVGLFEQIALADVYIHYDDVQFSKGSFTNRVQIKTAGGSNWLTVPLRELHLGCLIGAVAVDERQDWRGRHTAVLKQAYAAAPHVDEMLALVEEVYRERGGLAELCIAGMERVRRYFELAPQTRFVRSSELGIAGGSSRRVLDIVHRFEGNVYVTGHGARQYLDHALFEVEGVRVEYLDYRKVPYPQLNGEFTPFVSILDLIANCGKAGREVIASESVYWKDFLNR